MVLLGVMHDIDENLSIDCYNTNKLEEAGKQLQSAPYNLKILTFNIRSYQRNLDHFFTALKRFNTVFDDIVLTECWLNDGTILESYSQVMQYFERARKLIKVVALLFTRK